MLYKMLKNNELFKTKYCSFFLNKKKLALSFYLELKYLPRCTIKIKFCLVKLRVPTFLFLYFTFNFKFERKSTYFSSKDKNLQL